SGAVSCGARGCRPPYDGEGARPRAASVGRPCRRVSRAARLAVDILRRGARRNLERSPLRAGAPDPRRSGARRDGARGGRVPRPARRRSGVVEKCDGRAHGCRAASRPTERAAVSAVYVRVIVVETLIIVGLWFFGRLF